jgi:hypothetical protein
MLRYLRKKAYKRSYEFASRCQSRYFKEYMYKYINKHIKYRTKNALEYKELVDKNEINKNEYTSCKIILTNELKNIVDILLKINTKLYKISKDEYGTDYIINKNKDSIMNECVDILKHRLNRYELFNSEIDNVLRDVVDYSYKLRKGFETSDTVAKAKVQEHWVSRLPIFVFCVTCLLIVKILDIIIHYNEKYTYVKLLIIVMVYIISISMVYLRVYQTILSETKKTASEQYKKSKRALYEKFLRETDDQSITSDNIRSLIRKCYYENDIESQELCV